MATIVINRSESYCAQCAKLDRRTAGAIPWENGHVTYTGWSGQGPGCGEPWTAVATDYFGEQFSNIEEHYFGFENLRGLPVLKYRDQR